ncbi:hypothetical protein [Bradyrhizobium sp.]|uniref:hypothetical protein n=1 Tax=Bradyrhizobium sp. TaxID=376 RepID=UPI003C51A889
MLVLRNMQTRLAIRMSGLQKVQRASLRSKRPSLLGKFHIFEPIRNRDEENRTSGLAAAGTLKDHEEYHEEKPRKGGLQYAENAFSNLPELDGGIRHGSSISQ